jgi:membrane protease YdiL (CAAX protease family)
MIGKLFFDGERRLRNGWWVFAFYAGLAGMLIATSVLLNSKEGISIPYQLAMVAALTCLLQFARRRPVSEVTGALNAGALKQFAAGSLAGIALMLLPALILLAGGWVRFELSAQGAAALLPGLLMLAPAAILEELVFRGFVFRRLQDGLGLVLALLITSAFFVLTHMGNPGMSGVTKYLAALNIFMASIMFGLALVRTGGLAMPIGLHLMANFTQGTVLGFGVSGNSLPGMLAAQTGNAPVWLTGGQFGLEASLPGLLAVVALTVLLYRWPGHSRHAAG